MIRFLEISFLLLSFCLGAAEAGVVNGVLRHCDFTAAQSATVTLEGLSGSAQRIHVRATTDATGAFEFSDIAPETYSLIAAFSCAGFAAHSLTVTEGQTVTQNLVLSGRADEPTNPFVMADLVGRVRLMDMRYYLDVDDNGTNDYLLSFGPSWYNPGGDQRPSEGEQIAVRVGLLSYGETPIVIVYEMNSSVWRTPEIGHGGWGGEHSYAFRHCEGGLDTSTTDGLFDPNRIELFGDLMIPTCFPVPPNPPGVFMFHNYRDSSEFISHFLNFGEDFTGLPGGGSDPLCIVGALVAGTADMQPWVIVYEVNGEFVREPGDTTALLSAAAQAVNEPDYLGSPTAYLVARNFPNPFNPTTTINYSIPRAGEVTVSVFDLNGRAITTLVNARQDAGSYSVAWDGSKYSSGIYFCRVTVGTQSCASRMVLLK